MPLSWFQDVYGCSSLFISALTVSDQQQSNNCPDEGYTCFYQQYSGFSSIGKTRFLLIWLLLFNQHEKMWIFRPEYFIFDWGWRKMKKVMRSLRCHHDDSPLVLLLTSKPDFMLQTVVFVAAQTAGADTLIVTDIPAIFTNESSFRKRSVIPLLCLSPPPSAFFITQRHFFPAAHEVTSPQIRMSRLSCATSSQREQSA